MTQVTSQSLYTGNVKGSSSTHSRVLGGLLLICLFSPSSRLLGVADVEGEVVIILQTVKEIKLLLLVLGSF